MLFEAAHAGADVEELLRSSESQLVDDVRGGPSALRVAMVPGAYSISALVLDDVQGSVPGLSANYTLIRLERLDDCGGRLIR